MRMFTVNYIKRYLNSSDSLAVQVAIVFASPLLWSLRLCNKAPIQGRQDTTGILHLLSLALASTAF